MQWMKGQAALYAYGSEHGYLVIREETAVRLTRFRIAAGADGLAAVVALEAARNVIIFPLGRGPGRPGGEPELDALAESAKMFAETFEGGADLDRDGYPAWRHAEAERGVQLPSALPRTFEDMLDRWIADRPVDTVAAHEAHTVGGPADCARCQLLRDNQDWMAL
jgi:hypothetical protein